ncbi:hypothetical protein BVC80_1787g116 [Macleaya cordata]|uniref:Uncharacterized protein n=1 Tax=Macleaya cordata TaxID=56857 RepID=A0A200QU80_MACCD|nr:hypothetical protein BVC80_1787g116 [Macleaya cordata]
MVPAHSVSSVPLITTQCVRRGRDIAWSPKSDLTILGASQLRMPEMRIGGEGREAIAHRVMGPCRHSLDVIQCLRTLKEQKDNKSFSTFRERLYHLQRIEHDRVCFGRSGIHGWGLFARQDIQEGDMVSSGGLDSWTGNINIGSL